MVQTTQQWNLKVDRGPNWLFIGVDDAEQRAGDVEHLAEEIWEILERHFVYRVVIELEGIKHLPSALIGQLVLLHKRIHAQGGVLRLCGLSPNSRLALGYAHLQGLLPHFDSRHAAVLGDPPRKPR